MPRDTPRRGCGRKLIEQALAFTLRAKTELAFGADGVSCRIELPLQASAAYGTGRPNNPGANGSSCASPGVSAKATARPRPSATTQAFVP
jgi:hypothetical protein